MVGGYSVLLFYFLNLFFKCYPPLRFNLLYIIFKVFIFKDITGCRSVREDVIH